MKKKYNNNNKNNNNSMQPKINNFDTAQYGYLYSNIVTFYYLLKMISIRVHISHIINENIYLQYLYIIY